MKKRIGILLCAALLGIQASAAVVDFQVENTSFRVQNEGEVTDKTLEAAPFVNDRWRTMVPVRAISEAFGATVDWNGTLREVIVRLGGVEIRLYVDSTEALVGGEKVTLDCAPVIVEGRTFVPLRFVSEALSCNVNYAAASRHIVIDDTETVLRCGDTTFSFAELETLYAMFLEANRPMAEMYGMDETALQSACLQTAVETATKYAWIKTAFPAALSESSLQEILYSAERDGLTVPLTGMRDVLYEKLYYSGGEAAASYIEESADLESVYTARYTCAKHILVEEEETAKAVYEKAVGGADFDALVAEYNTDPGMEQNPNGYVFTFGEMVPEFETAAFAAAENTVTEPVQTAYGYHIIRREALPAFSEEIKVRVINVLINQTLEQTAAPTQLIDTAALAARLGISE
ncbi:MAG: peptidylprolyl isomerase [Clostridia bacterium]|nr:peptidylprolyl isomerase [Clostridia bacterium]